MKKKLTFIFSIVLAACVVGGVLFLLLADESTLETVKQRGNAAWAWVESHVLSDMLATGALVGLASLELIPVAKSFIESRNTFKKVAEDVKEYTVARIEYDKRSEEREATFYTRMEEIRLESEARLQAKEEELSAREEKLLGAIEEFRALAQGYNQNLISSEERLARTLHHVEVCADKTERMVYLGMSNSCELVKNGTARKIAEVEEHEE